MTIATLLTVALALGQPSVTDQPQAADADKVQLQRWRQYYRDAAAEYEMSLGPDRTTKLELHDVPVLTYFNSLAVQGTNGSIFVWTHNGRPEIAGAIWSKRFDDLRRVTHSLHSLSLEPLTAVRRGGVFWSPNRPGIEPVLIAGAAEPAATASLRLAQMRSLAREFTVSTVRVTVKRELRLSPQPIFRFEKPAVDRDGGLFMWFEDWDPELYMLIETRATPQGPKWHAGFGRFTNLPIAVKHKDAEVWRFEESFDEPALGGRNYRYISVHGIEFLHHLRAE